MHILIIPSWYPTQDKPVSGIFFREQAHALKDSGYKVGVISPQQFRLKTLSKGLSSKFSSIEYENDNGIPTYRRYSLAWLPRIPYGNSYLWVKSGEKLFREYITNYGKPDIIHAHSALMGGVLAEVIKKYYSIPYVITEHSTAYARNLLSDWQLNLAKVAFDAANARIFVSPALGNLLESYFYKAIYPWKWIPNMLDQRFILASNSKSQFKSPHFRFLNIALMTEKKGQIDLLQAFARKFKGNTNLQLRLGGDGIIRPHLEQLAEKLEIKNQVVFLGLLNREQVLEEMQACNAFVLSSHYETFGIVLTEALACGKPVIATACGGPECIVNKENGLLVPPKKPNKLGTAMLQLYHNIENYNSDIIRENCIQRFSPEAIVTQLTEVYSKL